MKSLKDTSYYKDVIHELNYSFGSYYIFDGIVVSELNEGIVYTWEEHGAKVTEDIVKLYSPFGTEYVYIANRINGYSVKPTDWIKFFKSYKNSLKGYGIVTYTQTGYMNAIIEKLFVKAPFDRFGCVEHAIEWAKVLLEKKAIAS